MITISAYPASFNAECNVVSWTRDRPLAEKQFKAVSIDVVEREMHLLSAAQNQTHIVLAASDGPMRRECDVLIVRGFQERLEG